MIYPTIPEIESNRQITDTFLGYNHNMRIGDGEFYDMKNMTSDFYPILSPRRQRGLFANTSSCGGLAAKDSLCYVSGENIVVGNTAVDLDLSAGDKSLVSMGAYVIILPDKKYINTQDLTEYGSIESSVTTSGTVTFTLCRIAGDAYSITYIQSSEPSSPANGQYWIDTSQTPHALKQYSSVSGIWASIATTYIKIAAAGIGTPFKVYDGVTISGITVAQLDSLNTDMIILERGDDYIVVTGILDAVSTQTDTVTVSRTIPNMDFVIESGNRLWGCRYGTSDNGSMVNEIYASKLGDFRNWSCFQGISTDSYRASVGTDGAFTGAVSHMDYPIFFKEGFMHKVYGNIPSNYQIQTTPCRGVQNGCSKSLAIVNEILYYKSRLGICSYDGSLPSEVSKALGDTAYFNAVAGAHGNKYYISMKDSDNVYHLFVYDTIKGLWHREDNTPVKQFCSCKNEMYYIDASNSNIKTIFGSGAAESVPIKWYCVTGMFGLEAPDKKYISRINIRMSITLNSRVYFYIQYDDESGWEQIATASGSNMKSISVPIRPRRCDHFRLKIDGEGYSKIYSICRTLETGSDR